MIHVLTAATALAATLLSAQLTPEPSPRWGALEMSFSDYRPNIDAEFGGRAFPYQAAFGGERNLHRQREREGGLRRNERLLVVGRRCRRSRRHRSGAGARDGPRQRTAASCGLIGYPLAAATAAVVFSLFLMPLPSLLDLTARLAR